VRPGAAEDLPRLFELWRGEVAAGRQDMLPSEQTLRRVLAHFDWGAKSRVAEQDGRIAGSVLVMSRASPQGLLMTVYAAGEPAIFGAMVEWGVRFSRAAGASVAQVFVAKGRGAGLEHAGLRLVRPWLRMDRGLDGLPVVQMPPGYVLADATTVPPGAWEDTFNRTFADHWRFAPRSEGEIIGGRIPGLCLMAMTADAGVPAGMTVGEVERYDDDPRPQPVGLISSVGTLAEHRRRGIATWLVVEILDRLRGSGARSASLYVDGHSAMKASELYQKIGFAVTREAEVWEATWP
jgi:ribosomal protein S18 acetylase RimI-like enzyme